MDFNEEDETFCQNVNHIRNSVWGATTDIYAMFEMILVSCIENNLSDEELGKYTLFILVICNSTCAHTSM